MPNKLNVLFLSMHYRPEPCDLRTSQLAKAFVEQGHRATALTSFPNYPFGKVYPGFRQKLVQKEVKDGVDVVRVPMFPDHSMSKKRRALSYLSFGISATVLGALFTKRPDLIWIHHPPLTTGIAGYLLAKIKRVPFVYEIHDLWPETLLSTGMIRHGRITRAIRKVCDFLHRRAAALVVTSPGMKGHLESQGVEPSKIHVLPQWTDESLLTPVPRDVHFGNDNGLAGKFNVMFTGNLGVAQSMDTILDAAKRVGEIPQIQIVLVGAGVELERLKKRAHHEGIENVRFLGSFPPEEMPKVFAWADALLLHLLNDPLFSITIPGKLQAYLAMGKPILCGAAGDAADIVDHTFSGITFAPEDACDMAHAIRECFEISETARSSFGENARKAYNAHFSQRTLVPMYERLFERVLERTAKTEAAAIVESGMVEAERTAA